MARVLITGAAGFIGSNLFKRCVELGWTVRGVDDLSNGHAEFLDQAWHMSVLKADFTGAEVLNAIGAGAFDVVFHLAAVPRVSYSVEHPLETHETNVTKTLRLIEACKGNVQRIVFASSSSVYGGADVLPTPETSPKDPKSPYALQKSIVEDYLQLYASLYGLDSACLRFFNVFGPNCLGSSPYATALSAWLTCIKQGKPLRSDGDGTQSRDLCYVDNVTHALVLAAQAQQRLDGRCFNVACGDRTTNRELLGYLLTRYPDAEYNDAPWRPGDVMHTQASIARIKSELGYEPQVRVWEGVGLTCDWYDAHWDDIKNMGMRT